METQAEELEKETRLQRLIRENQGLTNAVVSGIENRKKESQNKMEEINSGESENAAGTDSGGTITVEGKTLGRVLAAKEERDGVRLGNPENIFFRERRTNFKNPDLDK